MSETTTPEDGLAHRLRPDAPLRTIEPGLYSVLAERDAGAPYDRYAAAYDRAVSNATYLRIAWGLAPSDNADFIAQAFASDTEGVILDVAAGSSIDAAASYADTQRPTIVIDRSIAMLRRGRERLEARTGTHPEHVFFLQADANDLPLRDGSVTTLLCHGAYHVFPETDRLTAEWRRVLRPGGSAFVSSLVRGRWFGDRYLALLRRSGEIAPPRTRDEFTQRLAAELARPLDVEGVGNFAYARTRRPAEEGIHA